MLKVLSEFLGTAILALAVVGSGAMAQSLTEDMGLQLLINAAATGAVLWTIINLFGHISGAHFNPLVTLFTIIRREAKVTELISFALSQVLGAIAGTALANMLFDFPAFDISERVREGSNIYLSEIVATAGLISLIFHLINSAKSQLIPAAVGLWIFAAYFFTSSTSFANPAITIGRIFTKTFAGISPESALIFIPFQILGAFLGYGLAHLLKQSTTQAISKKPANPK
jgi:glycerol uptake facilitator-like aquaporin